MIRNYDSNDKSVQLFCTSIKDSDGTTKILVLALELLESSALVRSHAGREPVSTWVFRTKVLSVSGDMPNSFAMAVKAAHSDG
jgi:hypothetical protein